MGATDRSAAGSSVFIDSSTRAHGGEHWLGMTADGDSDALSCACVPIVRSRTDVWTIGSHVLGLRDVLITRTDIDVEGSEIVEMIR